MEGTLDITSSFICVFVVCILFLMILLASAIRIVPEYRRLAVYRLGRYLGEKGPGVVVLIPVVDRGIHIDIRDSVKKAQAYQNVFGIIGETSTFVHNDGEVEFDGKIWNAISSNPIPPGTRVRLKKVVFEIEAF